MPTFRASPVLLCAAALLAAGMITGCASSRLSAQMPPGVTLAGDWRLDTAHSDDLGKAVAQLREQSAKRRREVAREMARARARGTDADGDGPGGGSEGPGGGDDEGPPAGGGREGGEAGAAGESAAIGPGPSVPAADELLASVPQGEYLRITASAGSFTVTSGASSDQYTPGLESEISAQQGDAQQISGWKGAEYVIDTRPQWGPQIIQTYGLTKDARLSMTVRLTGRGINFLFTRIYDRTTRVSPLAPPTNN